MASLSERNFQVIGLGVTGHCWVVTAINEMTSQMLAVPDVSETFFINISLKAACTDLLGIQWTLFTVFMVFPVSVSWSCFPPAHYFSSVLTALSTSIAKEQ